MRPEDLSSSRVSDSSDTTMVTSSDTLVPSSAAGPSRKRVSEDKSVTSKRRKSDNAQDRTYCHHCRQAFPISETIRCTNQKAIGKDKSTKLCRLAWCVNDLSRRYGVEPETSRLKAVQGNFECPCCSGQCQTAACRKKLGLDPLGHSVSSKFTPAMAATAVQDTPQKPGLDSDSELSSIEDAKPSAEETHISTSAPAAGRAKPLKSKSAPSKAPKTSKATKVSAAKSPVTKKPTVSKSASGNLTPKSQNKKAMAAGTTPTAKAKANGSKKSAGSPAKSKSKASAGKSPKTKAKAKAISSADGKPKPVRRPEIIPDLPPFEKVDTRLDLTEAEQRMALREYLFRFRAALSIPERSLPPVDDFDRPLTEASVRVFAGSMLELIREEIEHNGQVELADKILHHREELRYYADLARFAAIYMGLEDSLGLRKPIGQERDGSLPVELDLSSRRSAASRLPSPIRVVQMLLALSERTLRTPAIRADLESQTEENVLRRQHLSAVKKETAAWETRKKKLDEASAKTKGAADSKAARANLASELREHQLRVVQLNVNLRADLSRRALRHESLGSDRDGRTYFVLSMRPVTHDGRPPIAWASGLLVWGKGDPGSQASDAVPSDMERWSHFGKSQSVKQLAKWVEWSWKKTIASVKTKNTKAGRAKLEVVIPSHKRARSSSSSALSVLSDNLLDDFEPQGYEPSPDMLDARAKDLVRRLHEVAEWLEVLEWKGMGEIV